MFIGRFQIGDAIPLTVQSVNGTGTAIIPTAAPSAFVYRGTGSLIQTITMPTKGRYETTAFFQDRLVLGADGTAYPADQYFIIYKWAISGSDYQSADTFEVMSGGDSDGNVIALDMVNQPEALFALYLTEAGTWKKGRDPR